jgi:isopentenyl diphosphate isomerase/L-lactate dehydrogenase-like FMN-dependent dehydrogenase
MVRGAGAAKTVVVLAAESSQPLERIAAEAKAPLWYQTYPGAELEAMRGRVQAAVKVGCKAVCLTLGAADSSGSTMTMDWSAIDRLRQGLAVPFLLKGIMTPEEARTAVQRGVQGIIVSNYRGETNPAFASPIEVLPGIAEAVGGKIPILIDGSFRRGGDVLKAIALGARAVLLGRPPLWGLAAYGADGVRYVLELMQAELARAMVMCGKPKLQGVDRAVVRIHRR